MAKPLTPDTKAIISAIAKADTAASESRDRIAGELHHHTEQDDERFRALTGLVNSIATDVKSLLESRTFSKGVWKTVVYASTAVSTVVGLIVAWLSARGH